MTCAHQFDQAGAPFRGVAIAHEAFDGRRHARRGLGWRHAQIAQTDDFALAHWNSTKDLRNVFADADADQKLLGLAEPARRADTPGIGGKLPNGLDIGREPGEAVGRALLAVEKPAVHLAL